MTKEEFLYDHDYDLIVDLISRYIDLHNPESSEVQKTSQKPLEVMKAGEFLL